MEAVQRWRSEGEGEGEAQRPRARLRVRVRVAAGLTEPTCQSPWLLSAGPYMPCVGLRVLSAGTRLLPLHPVTSSDQGPSAECPLRRLQPDMTTIPTAYAVEDPPESTWDPDDCFIVCEDVRVDEPDPEVCPPTSNVGFSLTPTVSPLLTPAIAPAHPLQFARPLPAQAMAGAHATVQAVPATHQMPPALPFYNPNPLPFYNPYQPVGAPGGYMPSLPQQPHQAGAPPPPVPPFRWDPAAAHLGTAGHPVGRPPAAIAPHPFSRDAPRPSPLFTGLATAAMVQQQAAQAAVRAAQADAARLGAAGVAAAAVVQAAAGLQRQAQAAAAAGVPQTVVATTAATAATQGPKAKAGKKEAAPAAAPADAAEGLGVCWVEVKAKPGWWPAQIMAAPPMVRPAHPRPCARAPPAHALHCPILPQPGAHSPRMHATAPAVSSVD